MPLSATALSAALLLRTCNPSKRHWTGACGLRMTDFEPGRALERVAEGVFGLGNAKSDPGRPSRRALGLRMIDFDPG